MRKEGTVNKKRQKWCAESEQWIPFSQWKKHKLALAEIANARRNQDLCIDEATSSWNPLRQRVTELEQQVAKQKAELNRARMTLNGYRETLSSAGRLLAALTDVSEIN